MTTNIPFEWIFPNLELSWDYENSTNLAESEKFPKIPNQPNEGSKFKCYWYMNMVADKHNIALNICLAEAKNSDYFWTEIEVSLISNSEEWRHFLGKNLFHINLNREYNCKRFISTNTLIGMKNRNGSSFKIQCKMIIRVERCIINATPKEIPDYEKLFNDPELGDSFVKTDSEKTFKVHRDILRARSTTFADAEKWCENKEPGKDFIPIEGYNDEVVEEFLRYIYCGRVNNLNKFMDELLKLGDWGGVSDLVRVCLEEMCKSINNNNAVELLRKVDYYSYDHGVDYLMAPVLNFIVINIKDIDDSQMERLTSSVLKKILKMTLELKP